MGFYRSRAAILFGSPVFDSITWWVFAVDNLMEMLARHTERTGKVDLGLTRFVPHSPRRGGGEGLLTLELSASLRRSRVRW